MRCVLVLYLVVTIFVVVSNFPDLCVYKNYEEKTALCGRHDIEHTLDFIPPISQYITYIDLLAQPLKQLPYNAFRNLGSQSNISRIVLRNCEISHVNASALLYLHNLTNIDLSHNDIKYIDSKLFSHTKQIKFIYMGYNKIEVVPNGLFQNLLLLKVVYLDHNQIHQVESFSFNNTPSLRTIYLNNNQIEFMNMLFKDEFDNLTTFWLYGNPWKCNCELGPLYEFLIEFNRFNLHKLVCEKPSTLQGRNWNDISRDEFVCPSEDAISTQDSVMTSTEPITTTEQDDAIPVTVYSETTYQPVDPGTPQPPVIPIWLQYTILGLVLVCVIAVIIGVVLVVRYIIRATSYRRQHARLPTIVNRGSDRRTNACHTNIPMQDVQSSVVPENGDSGLSTDDGENEELISIRHSETRETTIS